MRLYKVEDTLVNGTHRYSIYDCGTSDWQTCGTYLEHGPTVANVNADFGGVATKSPYGTNSLQIIMGASGTPTVFGGALGDIKEIANYGDSYTVHALDFTNGACSHYDSGIHIDRKLTTSTTGTKTMATKPTGVGGFSTRHVSR